MWLVKSACDNCSDIIGSENPVPPKIEQENSISVASVTMPQSAVTSSLYEKLLPRDESM